MLSIFTNPVIGLGGRKALDKSWATANKDYYRKVAIEKLDADLNKGIDERCRELAMNWLGEKQG